MPSLPASTPPPSTPNLAAFPRSGQAFPLGRGVSLELTGDHLAEGSSIFGVGDVLSFRSRRTRLFSFVFLSASVLRSSLLSWHSSVRQLLVSLFSFIVSLCFGVRSFRVEGERGMERGRTEPSNLDPLASLSASSSRSLSSFVRVVGWRRGRSSLAAGPRRLASPFLLFLSFSFHPRSLTPSPFPLEHHLIPFQRIFAALV